MVIFLPLDGINYKFDSLPIKINREVTATPCDKRAT